MKPFKESPDTFLKFLFRLSATLPHAPLAFSRLPSLALLPTFSHFVASILPIVPICTSCQWWMSEIDWSAIFFILKRFRAPIHAIFSLFVPSLFLACFMWIFVYLSVCLSDCLCIALFLSLSLSVCVMVGRSVSLWCRAASFWDISINTFSHILGSDGMNERANKKAKRSARTEQAVRSKQTSERRSKWPNTLRVGFIVILPTVRSLSQKVWIRKTPFSRACGFEQN